MKRHSIIFPWPAKELHAHAKGKGYHVKARATKHARQCARAIVAHLELAPMTAPVRVSYVFAMPDRRRRDIENLRQACKPYIDGIVDAGLLTGDSWDVLRSGCADAELAKPDTPPHVRITLTEENE
jgi:Holliday junction resolvase RusA-like endonuclease